MSTRSGGCGEALIRTATASELLLWIHFHTNVPLLYCSPSSTFLLYLPLCPSPLSAPSYFSAVLLMCTKVENQSNLDLIYSKSWLTQTHAFIFSHIIYLYKHEFNLSLSRDKKEKSIIALTDSISIKAQDSKTKLSRKSNCCCWSLAKYGAGHYFKQPIRDQFCPNVPNKYTDSCPVRSVLKKKKRSLQMCLLGERHGSDFTLIRTERR